MFAKDFICKDMFRSWIPFFYDKKPLVQLEDLPTVCPKYSDSLLRGSGKKDEIVWNSENDLASG